MHGACSVLSITFPPNLKQCSGIQRFGIDALMNLVYGFAFRFERFPDSVCILIYHNYSAD